MMVDVTLSVVLQIVQTVGVLVGITYYITIMRNTQRNQKTQMFMPIYNRVMDPGYRRDFSDIRVWQWEDYDDWEQKYYHNRDEWAKLMNVCRVHDMTAILLERDQIDLDLVSDVMRYPTIRLWEGLESVIREFRVQRDFHSFGEGSEYLYNEMKKRTPRKLKPLKGNR
jgi:hypothetical protein